MGHRHPEPCELVMYERTKGFSMAGEEVSLRRVSKLKTGDHTTSRLYVIHSFVESAEPITGALDSRLAMRYSESGL